jgi:hypothetical protein
VKRSSAWFLIVILLAGVTGVPAPIHAQGDPAYAVATHYPDVGGTDPAPKDAVEVSYGVFNNRLDDYYAVDVDRAAEVMALIQAQTGFPAVMRNVWDEVAEDQPAIQVVNNVPVEGALYTLFLPPGWNEAASLPVLISGNGAGHSNNRRLYGDREIIGAIVSVVGLRADGTGFIVAISNCGGTESQGVDEPTLRSVGAFLNWIDARGGDKTNVIAAGGSRGGGTALMWAINPLGLDYDIHTVFAVVPPTHYGSLARVSILTYPAMAGIGALISHSPDAWHYDDPQSAVNQFPSPFLEAILGTGDPAEADALGPIGRAEGLRGKQVFLAAGAHDAFFPLAHFVAFDRRLDVLDIPHTTVITLANGHESSTFFEQTLFLYLTSVSQGRPARLPVGRFYFIDEDPRADDQVSLGDFFQSRRIDADPAVLPVIAQFPYKAGVGNPADVVVCGPADANVDLRMVDADGAVMFEIDGPIGPDECMMQRFTVEVPPGTYTWTLTVDGEPVDPTYTPTRDADGCGLPAVTIVEESQPDPDNTFAFNSDMSFGLDQYSGEAEICRVE